LALSTYIKQRSNPASAHPGVEELALHNSEARFDTNHIHGVKLSSGDRSLLVDSEYGAEMSDRGDDGDLMGMLSRRIRSAPDSDTPKLPRCRSSVPLSSSQCDRSVKTCTTKTAVVVRHSTTDAVRGRKMVVQSKENPKSTMTAMPSFV